MWGEGKGERGEGKSRGNVKSCGVGRTLSGRESPLSMYTSPFLCRGRQRCVERGSNALCSFDPSHPSPLFPQPMSFEPRPSAVPKTQAQGKKFETSSYNSPPSPLPLSSTPSLRLILVKTREKDPFLLGSGEGGGLCGLLGQAVTTHIHRTQVSPRLRRGRERSGGRRGCGEGGAGRFSGGKGRGTY